MWEPYNPNPQGRNVADCAVRAVCKAMDVTWEEAYISLCLEGLIVCDMPHANHVWGEYLKEHGFKKQLIQDNVSAAEFADAHPQGTYVLALSGHVVCVKNGALFDSWDSGNEVILYYWEKG